MKTDLDDFAVQACHEPWGGAAAINAAVAVHFGQSTFVVRRPKGLPNALLWIDGKAVALADGANMPVGTVMKLSRVQNAYVLHAGNGIAVRLTIQDLHITIDVTTPKEFCGHTMGLAGFWSGVVSDENWPFPAGQYQQWVTQPGESYFGGGAYNCLTGVTPAVVDTFTPADPGTFTPGQTGPATTCCLGFGIKPTDTATLNACIYDYIVHGNGCDTAIINPHYLPNDCAALDYCSSHGKCDAVNNVCICAKGFAGKKCEMAVCGCLDNQECVNGVCGACSPGFSGPTCQVSDGCDTANAGGGTAWSQGDPHQRTFDGVAFDYQRLAGHWYCRSKRDDFAVQTCHVPYGGTGAAVNGKIAVRYNGELVVLSAAGNGVFNLYVNGKQLKYLAGEVYKSPRGTLTIAVPTANNFNVRLETGLTVQLTAVAYWINMVVNAPNTYVGQTYGFCGSWDCNTANDMPNLAQLGQQTVGVNETFFSGAFACPAAPAVVVPPVDPTNFHPTDVEEATACCLINGIKNIVVVRDREIALQNCIFDFIVSGKDCNNPIITQNPDFNPAGNCGDLNFCSRNGKCVNNVCVCAAGEHLWLSALSFFLSAPLLIHCSGSSCSRVRSPVFSFFVVQAGLTPSAALLSATASPTRSATTATAAPANLVGPARTARSPSNGAACFLSPGFCSLLTPLVFSLLRSPARRLGTATATPTSSRWTATTLATRAWAPM